MTAPEFSRPERIDMIGAGVRNVVMEASEAERSALAARFELLAVDRLEARFRLHRDSGGIVAEGRVTARVVQSCIATGEPVPATIDEPVALRFVADDMPGGSDGGGGEVELEADALDIVPYDGGAIDLGEAAAETMALALDPFPRSEGAAAALRAAGVLSEEEAKPAGAFAGLKDALAKRGPPKP